MAHGTHFVLFPLVAGFGNGGSGASTPPFHSLVRRGGFPTPTPVDKFVE